MPSQTAIGRYEVVSVLGQGARGAVYKAIDPLTGRAVAVKTIALAPARRAEFEARFYRETSASRLNHANIVSILDVGVTGDFAYVATEYLEGESLREMLDSGAALPIETIVGIAARVADALHYAHENHVVHRDLRPANIIVTSERDVKVVGFGLAQISAGSRAPPDAFQGAPAYMAPEQVAGGNADGRADIFALGVVLYEMLSGQRPFDDDDVGATICRILKEAPVPPGMLNPRVPPALDRIVGRALAKRPRDRYQTALALACDLRSLDAGARQKARRPAASAMREAIRGRRLPLLGKVSLPRPLWLALPLLVAAALAMHSQEQRAPGEGGGATLATPAASAPKLSATPGAPEVESAPPPVTTPPVSEIAVVPAAPALSPTRAVSAKPKVSPKPAVSLAAATPAAPRATEPEIVPPRVVQAKATLALAISPWGEVLVDGSPVGVSPPLTTLQLEPGPHDVEIRNQAFMPYRETVNLEAGASLKLRYKFK